MPCFMSPEPFDWKAFQKFMHFSDAELKEWMDNPKLNIGAIKMCSPEMQRKWMIIEVVKSHGCANGLAVGDRLFFKGMGYLMPERSSGWCGHNFMYIGAIQDVMHNMVMQGKDPNTVYPNTFTCPDTTHKYGWGYVESMVYVVNEEDLDRLDEVKKLIREGRYSLSPIKG